MSQAAQVPVGYGKDVKGSERSPIDWGTGWKPLLWSCGLLVLVNIFLWFWDYKYAFTAGLDSASRDFTLYYRTLFWGELIAIGVITGIYYGWLIKNGREVIKKPCSNAEEIRRIAVLWSMIGATSLSVYIEASFWPNWDGSWHQTLVRDTALTPIHIPMFYFWFPLSVVLSLGAYIYGRFWIPGVYAKENGFPWSFFLLISAAVLECVQVAFNEWGHSLWISEEFFSAPFHWPFVTYGWLAGGMFAVWGETIIRLFEIHAKEEALKPAGVAS